MQEPEIISWIFLATTFASKQEPTNFEGILQIADGINHSVPTHKELQYSLNWLMKAELVEKKEKRYQLTTSGIETIKLVESRTNNIVLNIWNELTKEIEKYESST